MRFTPFIVALAGTTTALPASLEDRQNDTGMEQANTESAGLLCKRFFGALPTRPECCRGDVLGLAHHGCSAPYPAPDTITDFVNGCMSKGKAPECCATALLGLGLLCHTPTGNGFSTSMLASENGSEVTIVEITQSEDESEPATITEVTKELNETEQALLAEGPVSTVEELDNELGFSVPTACDDPACLLPLPKPGLGKGRPGCHVVMHMECDDPACLHPIPKPGFGGPGCHSLLDTGEDEDQSEQKRDEEDKDEERRDDNEEEDDEDDEDEDDEDDHEADDNEEDDEEDDDDEEEEEEDLYSPVVSIM